MNPDLKTIQNNQAIADATNKALLAGQTVNLGGVTTASQVGANTSPTFPINTTATQSPTSMGSIKEQPTPVAIPTPAVGTIPSIQSIYDSVYNTQTPSSAEQESDALKTNLRKLIDAEGNKAGDQLAAEEKAGVQGFQKTVNDLSSQLNALNNEAAAAKLKTQNQPILGSIVAGQMDAIDRDRAVKALTLSAGITAAQGNLALAQQQADRAIEVKYAGIENELEYFNQFITLNQNELSREQEKKATLLQAKLAERQEQADKAKANDVAIQNVMLEAAKNGADAVTLGNIQASTNPQQAISLAGNALSAPFRLQQAQQEFQNSMAKEQLKISQANLRINQAELGIKQAQAKADAIKNAPANPAFQQASAQNNIQNIDTLLKDTAIRTAVGPSGFARLVGRGLDSATGARQNFIASVDQLASQLTLDSLVNAKARGATFGALSEGELLLLNNSASKINKWAKRDDKGNVIAYNASEKDFKAELDKINNFAKLDALIKGIKPEDIGVQLLEDGHYWTKNSDGSLTQIY
jgi:hypothetical protein